MLSGGGGARADVVLVEDGQPAARIVVPDDASGIVLFAAEELQSHIAMATGATLSIVAESGVADDAGNVFVGDCRAARAAGIDVAALPANGFVLKTIDDQLYLVGHDEQINARGSNGAPVGTYLDYNRSRIGTMFAVYEFLETQLGVRWLWPGEVGTYVPRAANIVVSSLDQTEQPKYIFKHWRVPEFIRQETGWSSPAARDEFLIAQNTWLRRHRYMQVLESRYFATHAFGQYWRDYGESHPEYFAMLPNGKREPLAGDTTGRRITMCVAEPALWKQAVEDWMAYREPFAPWVRAGENDSPGICTCEKCRSWDAPDPRFANSPYWGKGEIPTLNERFRLDWSTTPSLSDRYARFYLALLEEAKKVDPDAQVTGYAYANYWQAPQQTRLHEDILISVVPSTPDGRSSSTYFPYTDRKSRQFREQWDGWGRTGARLVLRPNMTLSGHNFPIYYADRMGADVIHAVTNGMVGSDFDSLRGSWGTQAPTLYVLARAQERPELGVDHMLDEFYAAFGEAAEEVRDYFNHWRAVSRTVSTEQMNDWVERRGVREYSRWFMVAPFIFTDKVMAKGRGLLDRARAVNVSDAVVRQRLEFLHRGLKDVELLLALLEAYETYQRAANEAALSRYVQAMARLDQHRQDSEGWHIGNFNNLAREERMIFDWSLLEAHADLSGALPMAWDFRWDPEEHGQDQRWFAEDVSLDEWQRVTLGAWQTQPVGQAWRDEHGGDYDGVAWYRTTFESPQKPSPGARAVLRFGAVDEAARVWVNGQQVLDRPFDAKVNPDSWNEPFDVDITDVVRHSGANVVVVRVESRAGLGGITRPVRLVIEEPSRR